MAVAMGISSLRCFKPVYEEKS